MEYSPPNPPPLTLLYNSGLISVITKHRPFLITLAEIAPVSASLTWNLSWFCYENINTFIFIFYATIMNTNAFVSVVYYTF